MRSLLFISLLLSKLSLSQGNDYHFSGITEDYIKGEDTIALHLSAIYYTNKLSMDTCYPMHDRWHWWYGHENEDSILTYVRNKIAPFIGEKGAERTVVSKCHYYKKHTELDKENTLSTFYPSCYEIALSYECYVELGDSLWLPFHVSIDKKGNVIDTQSMPKALKNMENFDFMSVTKAYQIADEDPFMEGYGVSRFISLKYSRKMDLFYYELESQSGDLLIDKSTDHSTYTETNFRHLFINPVNDEILWKTKVKHTLDFIGCIYDYSKEVPDSPLTR